MSFSKSSCACFIDRQAEEPPVLQLPVATGVKAGAWRSAEAWHSLVSFFPAIASRLWCRWSAARGAVQSSLRSARARAPVGVVGSPCRFDPSSVPGGVADAVFRASCAPYDEARWVTRSDWGWREG